MKTAFVEREQAFEAEYAHRAEQAFVSNARALKALARWAAAELALKPEGAAALLTAAQEFAMRADGSERMIARVLKDFRDGGVSMTEGRLRLKLSRFAEG